MSLSKSRSEAFESEVRAVREMFESHQYDVDEIVRLAQDFYPESNPERIQKSVETCLPRFPRDCCDIASLALKSRLGEGEVTSGLYYTRPRIFDRHAFLKLGNTLCDITADQFGGPRLYIGEFVLPWAIKPYSWERGPLSQFEKWPIPKDLIKNSKTII